MERKLSIINIILPIILFTILQFITVSESLTTIILMTIFIGWLLPFICPIITGISMLNDSHHKMALIFNILDILLCITIIILISLIIDKHLIAILVEYIILTILGIINTINQIIYLKNHKDPEIQEIKKVKKENNGIIK